MTMHHDTAVELFQHNVTSLDVAQRTCPALKKIIAQARRHATSPQRGAGLVVPTTFLKAVKGFDRVGYQALLLSLPADFEPLLPALMDTKPRIINDVTLDVQTMLTSARWMLENRVKVLVDIEPLNRITSANGMRLPAVYEYLGLTSIPFIMCAGNSIGLGGLLMTSKWEQEVRVHQEVAANHWRPESVYSPSEIALAHEMAAEQGLRPWTGKLWAVSDKTVPAIHVPVHPYREMRNHS